MEHVVKQDLEGCELKKHNFNQHLWNDESMQKLKI